MRKRDAQLLLHWCGACGGSRRLNMTRAQRMQSVGAPHGLPPSAAVRSWLASVGVRQATYGMAPAAFLRLSFGKHNIYLYSLL
jgi:hypothetical protein